MKTFTVKRHGIPITCYYTPTHKGETVYHGWTIRHDRRRIFKSSREDIEAEAERIIEGIRLGKGAANQLSASEASEYKEACQIAASLEKPLLVALSEYSEASRLLAGRCGLIQAARHWIDTAQGVTAKKVSDAVSEYLIAKEQDGVSEAYLKTTRVHLNQFKARFDCHVAMIDSAKLDEWLRTIENPRTRHNTQGTLSAFFGFCKVRRWLPDSWNELARLASTRFKSAAPVCYSPKQFKAVLRATEALGHSSLVCYLILRGMLGVRDSEAFRVEASQIRDGHLIIEAGQAKVRGRRRIVPLHGKSAEWFKCYAPKSGRIVPLNYDGTWQRTIRRIFQNAKVPRVNNALRDSFISYRMAQTKDAPKVSDEAGNSPQKIHQHYRELTLPTGELITERLARQWFAILPDNS